MANSERFLITHWCGIPHKFIRNADGTLALDRFVEMKESGINLMASYDYGYETNCEMLAACEKLGMKVIMCLDRIDRAVRDAEHRRELLASAVKDYSCFPALLGYHIIDEPNSGSFPALAAVREILAELDPVHEAYYNLFPNYASLEMLGNPSYYDHVEQFVRDVKPDIISYDHYHFIKGAPMEQVEIKDEREKGIYEAAFQKVERPGFFDNIEDVRAVSLKTGTPFMVIILVVEHGPYRNLTEGEIRWEVFQSLAYGSKRLSYFTYWTPGVDRDEGDDMWHWQNGMIAKNGDRCAHYYMVQAVNKDLQTLGDILLRRKSEAVFHFGRVPDGKVAYWPGAYGKVTAMDAACATVGFFEDGLALLANKDYEKPMTVTFKVSDGVRVLHFDKASGLWKQLEAVDGAYTVTLAPGDGELVRLD